MRYIKSGQQRVTYSVPCYHTPPRPQEFPTYNYDTVLFVVLNEFFLSAYHFQWPWPYFKVTAASKTFEILGKFLYISLYIFLHLTVMYSSGWVGMSACPLVVLACESLHVCTVCIWRCEHARFCVEVFLCAIYKFSFIHWNRLKVS